MATACSGQAANWVVRSPQLAAPDNVPLMTDKPGFIAITGASSGIGAALARSFASSGHRLLLMARRIERLVALDLPDTICAEVDVTDIEAIREAVASAEERFGPIEAMINNAGAMLLGPVDEQDPAEWRQMMDVNVMGVLNGSRVALDSMLPRESGTIINLSSIAGFKAFPNHVAYVGSKFAVHGISENIRTEVASRNVRVSIVSPGAVETELLGHTTSAEVIGAYEEWKGSIGGALDPQSIVNAVRYIYDQPQSVCVREVVVANTLQVD